MVGASVLVYYVNADEIDGEAAANIGQAIAGFRPVGGPRRDRTFWVLTAGGEGSNPLHEETARTIAKILGAAPQLHGHTCNSYQLRQPFLGPWPADDPYLARWLNALEPLPYGAVVVGGTEAALFDDVAPRGWLAKLVTYSAGQLLEIRELTDIG
jgi:hypothetical protein